MAKLSICTSDSSSAPSCNGAITGAGWNSGEHCPKTIDVSLDTPVKSLTLGWVPNRTPQVGTDTIQFTLINEAGHEIHQFTKTYPATMDKEIQQEISSKEVDFEEMEKIFEFPISRKIARIKMTWVSMTYQSWVALRKIYVVHSSN